MALTHEKKEKMKTLSKGLHFTQLFNAQKTPLALFELYQELKKYNESHIKDISQINKSLQKLESLVHGELERVKDDRDSKNADTIDEEKLIQSILSKIVIPKPINGKDGYTPIKGVDYFDGKDAKLINEEDIIESILSKIVIPQPIKGEKGDNGKDAIFDEEQLKKDIIESIQKDKLIDISHIRNAQGFIKDGVKYRFEELMRGGGIPTTSGNNQEKSITSPNGVIITFTFTHLPNLIYWNGAFQTLNDDYTVSGYSIIFTTSAGIPQPGDKIINVY